MNILLIIGSSKSWLDDLKNILEYVDEYDVCCINYSILKVPCILLEWPKYYYSYHLRFRYYWEEGRVLVKLTSVQPHTNVHHCPLVKAGKDDWGGSSALQAVKIALQYWKYGKIILCGVALDPPYDKIFYNSWCKSFSYIRNNVRSMSGKTRELLGAPTKEWLYG